MELRVIVTAHFERQVESLTPPTPQAPWPCRFGPKVISTPAALRAS